METSLVALTSSSEAEATQNLVAGVKEFVENFPAFLSVVEETYQQLEEKATIAQRSMEISAGELTNANSNLFRLNRTFDAMVNSLGEGFVLFGKDGVCLDVYSKACEDLLEGIPAGKQIAEVLGVPPEKRESFTGWTEILFQDTLDFAEFSKLGPRHFAHSKGKKVSIEFMPVRDNDGKIELIIAIATDFTKEFEAEERAKTMQAQAALVTSILKNGERFTQFVQQFRTLWKKCGDILATPIFGEKELLEIKGHLHGLKGASGSFGMLAIQTRIHEMESSIARLESLKGSCVYLAQELPKLRDLFELTLEENAEIIGALPASEEPQREVSLSKLFEIERLLASDECDRKTLRNKIMTELISQPCSKVFSRFDSEIQKTASRLGKKVNRLSVSGDAVRIVPELYPNLFLNLGHIFRNIADHGIESPEERQAAGKELEGNVKIAIRNVPGNRETIEIRVSDDGRGVDIEKIRNKLREMGREELAQNGTRDELLDAIFIAGLSTAQAVTEISGRGIGLDAVRTSISDCGGKISVESTEGKGTTFIIQLPLRRSLQFTKTTESVNEIRKL
ncbi:MAG: ATP-binding protein [Bdellovibrionota bacterium]